MVASMALSADPCGSSVAGSLFPRKHPQPSFRARSLWPIINPRSVRKTVERPNAMAISSPVCNPAVVMTATMVVETVKVVMEGGVDVLAVKDAKLAVNVAVEVSNVLVVVEVGGAAPLDVEPVVMVRVAFADCVGLPESVTRT